MSSYATSSLVAESTRFCAIRWPVLALSWWNRTVLRLTAEYSLMGTLTSPNEMAPLQIDLGIFLLSYHVPDFGNMRMAVCAARPTPVGRPRARCRRAGPCRKAGAACPPAYAR